jgi:uncharacterized iron-regulated membrane protein
MRTALFWLHLICGCVAGLVILTMSATGVLLMYERQLLANAERGPFRLAQPPASRMTAEELLRELQLQQKGSVMPRQATLIQRADPREPVELNLGRGGAWYADPGTGKILGKAATGMREAMDKLRGFHRWFALEGPNRATARIITGSANFLFLILVVSGLILWFPRQWTWRHLRPIVWFRGGLSGKARDFNWHNTAGFWCLIPLFFIVISALPMSFNWANDLLFHWTGSPLPPRPASAPAPTTAKGQPTRDLARDPAPASFEGQERLWAKARGYRPNWVSISAPAVFPATGPVNFTVDEGDGGQPQLRHTLTLDPETGAIVKAESLANASAGRQLRSWARFLHTGEALGLAGQTIAGIASAAGVLLVWTGYALALHRWNNRRRTNQVA